MSYSTNAEAIIRLNVGGTRFETTASTLRGSHERNHKQQQHNKENFFCALLDPEQPMLTLKDSDGAFFIDRDPTLFSAVLSFLRTGRVDAEAFGISDNALRAEAAFYCVQLPVAPESLVKLHSHGMYFACSVAGDLSTAQRLLSVQRMDESGGIGKFAQRKDGAWTWSDVVFELVGSTIVRVMRAPRRTNRISRATDDDDSADNNNSADTAAAVSHDDESSTDDDDDEGEEGHHQHQHIPAPQVAVVVGGDGDGGDDAVVVNGDGNNDDANNPAVAAAAASARARWQAKRTTRRTLFMAVITPDQLVVISPNVSEWGAAGLTFFPSNEPLVGSSFRASDVLNNDHANISTILSFCAPNLASVVLVNYTGKVTVARTAEVVVRQGCNDDDDEEEEERGDVGESRSNVCASNMVLIQDPLFRSRFPSRFLCFNDVMIEFVKYPAPLQTQRDRLNISEQLMYYKLVH